MNAQPSDEMWREGPRDELVLAVPASCGEKQLPDLARKGPVVMR